ncbi:pyridoxamine 5'-phosphate oxidase family protein [Prochlorococcus marinus]|uniref:pyridoxamine 5'-phosphate oxidase family protein n=1 Tax=Prochlorococcus marinus TaxID=1219 RepID=UPI0022B39297|nr:pyridoxamine 5'-phosphate oxidase family protein [Prochlorococcus marinus]
MPPWLSQLSSALTKESKLISSRWIQLATIGIDNTPRVRTVVFRGWTDSFEMEIYTDKRSQKYYELNVNNNVEICWVFLNSKCQFRFRGTSIIDLGKDNLRHWNQLSDTSKSMWGWPKPGDHYIHDNEIETSFKGEEKLSHNFSLLKIEIKQVDQLIIRKPIHIRRKWVKEEEWIEERINP